MAKAKRRLRTPAVSPGGPGAIAALGPDLPELRQARALWQLNRFDEALAHFDRAVRQCPNNSLALIDASRAMGARFEIARAESLLDRLIQINGRSAEVLHLAGQSYRMIFRPEKAFECFRRALALDRRLTDARLELALLCERRHRLDEAASWIEECLQLDPDYHAARLIQARLLRRRKGEDAAETILRDLAQREEVHPQLRAQAWVEIAQLLDRSAQYDDAMGALLRGKEILLRDDAPLRREADVILGHLGRLAEGVTAEHFRRWTDEAQAFPPRRNAVLCGFPRTGTTLLEQVLDSHSGLVSSDEREAFARDIFPAMWQTAATPVPEIEILDAVPALRLVAQRERYFNYMEAALHQPIGERVHLDKNPTLTLLLPAVLRLLPETKVIVALRDPRDVVLSCFFQYLPMNLNSVTFLTLERAATRYAFDMKIWRQLRAILAAPWLEVRYEDTVHHLEREARRTLEFLGLPWEPGVLNYRDRLKEKPVASPTYEAVSKPLYTSSIGRWRHYEKYFGSALPLLQPSLEAFGYS
jgi:tetratricopeptide (TPR) repeat protein